MFKTTVHFLLFGDVRRTLFASLAIRNNFLLNNLDSLITRVPVIKRNSYDISTTTLKYVRDCLVALN